MNAESWPEVVLMFQLLTVFVSASKLKLPDAVAASLKVTLFRFQVTVEAKLTGATASAIVSGRRSLQVKVTVMLSADQTVSC